MAVEGAGDAHGVIATIEPAITLLGLGLAAAFVSNALRLSPIVGYLALGAGLAATGFGERFSGPLVAALAEIGVMFLLFNLGLHFSLKRIRAEAGDIFGFGALQMAVAGGAFVAAGFAIGLPAEAAIIGGFALGLSSTAVVLGVLRERDQEDCPVGRSAQAILIFQDIAAIALLVAAGALASGEGSMGALLGVAALKALAAFAIAVLFARFLTDRLFGALARIRSSEVNTATALFIALAAGWATGAAGLSLTLGAFLGGVAVAESRYRMMVQTEIEAFRGLFLGFFFISVGLAIDPALIAANWALVLAAAAGLVAVKCALNVAAALVNRWSVPGSVQLGFLLGQGSEFALVLFSIPALAGLMGERLTAILVTAIALSLAVTPFVSNLGRTLAGRLRRGPADEKLAGDDAPVVIFSMGKHGRAVADALEGAGIGYLAIENDADRFETALADGYPVHSAAPGDPRGWDAMGMGRRDVAVVTNGRIERIDALTPMVRERLPDVARVIALDGPEHLERLREDGARPVDIAGPDGSERLVDTVFAALGRERPARREEAGALAA